MKSKYNDLVRSLNRHVEDYKNTEKMEHFYKCFEDLKEEIGLKDEDSSFVINILKTIDPVFAERLNLFVGKTFDEVFEVKK